MDLTKYVDFSDPLGPMAQQTLGSKVQQNADHVAAIPIISADRKESVTWCASCMRALLYSLGVCNHYYFELRQLILKSANRYVS